jgi:hypothetical protein
MATRPTTVWREGVKVEAELLAAGKIDEAIRAGLYPPDLIRRTDEVLDSFEAAAAELHDPSNEEVLAKIEQVVLMLNEAHREFSDAFETPERDLLCQYIDEVFTEAGIDLDVVARHRGLLRRDLTDEWRTW